MRITAELVSLPAASTGKRFSEVLSVASSPRRPFASCKPPRRKTRALTVLAPVGAEDMLDA
jgi:hypothetical protein